MTAALSESVKRFSRTMCKAFRQCPVRTPTIAARLTLLRISSSEDFLWFTLNQKILAVAQVAVID